MQKARLEKTLEVLVEKAEDFSDLAKDQRASADKQHESAHKLEQLSHDLEADVAEMKSELGIGAREPPVAAVPPKARKSGG